MKSNREIRAEAWGLLWREGWLFRLFAANGLLVVLAGVVIGAIAYAFATMGITTLQDFAATQREMAGQGLTYSASSDGAFLRMCGASFFQAFVQYLMSGVVMYGFTLLTLRAVRRRKSGWLMRAVFGGLSMPFSVFWLNFGLQIRTGLWIFAAVVPTFVVVSVLCRGSFLVQGAMGLVATVCVMAIVVTWLVYRYYCVWFLRVDHSDWSAGRCFAEGVQMMKGRMGAAIRLDCSYWLGILGLLPFLVGVCCVAVKLQANGLDALAALDYGILGVSVLGLVIYGVILGWYIALGHAIFYRERVAELQVES